MQTIIIFAIVTLMLYGYRKEKLLDMKKILFTLAVLFAVNTVFSNDFYEQGMRYMNSYQYSSAITEFKNALRINYMDNSARIGLINAYIARATYSANAEKKYQCQTCHQRGL